MLEKLFWIIFFFGLIGPIFGSKNIEEIEYLGLNRTDKNWLNTFLELKAPPFKKPDEKKLENLTLKLTTSGAFYDAKVYISKNNPETLVIDLKEKWTTIPVVRGVYGGGTPLQVIGIYDIHGLGRLHTYGMESRKYGNASPGGVIWFRAPRWLNGKYTLGLEFWKDNRIREIYGSDKKLKGNYLSETEKLRLIYMKPFNSKSFQKIGVDFKFQKQQRESYKLLEKTPSNQKSHMKITSMEKGSTLSSLQLRYEYDNISAKHFDIAGSRVIGLLGINSYKSKKFTNIQAEYFYYQKLSENSLMGFHLFGSYAETNFYPSIVFLGGFDSIRGFPDGIIYGNKALYSNVEYRNIIIKKAYLQWQGVIFADFGTSYLKSHEKSLGRVGSIGTGFRISYPKIHRLVFRFDIAKPIENNNKFGISLGMNQFFDPYKPL